MRQLQLLIALIICVLPVKGNVTAVFNWSEPQTLTPSYEGPTADNRYGEYISNVEFSDNGVSLKICDDNVKESSQKARFLYGYTTQTIEMRAYLNSDIIITAPEGMCVSEVNFEGAKADEYYMSSYDEESTFTNGTWRAGTEANEAKFYVDATINCTKITVTCTNSTGVRSIAADAAPATEEWYSISGSKLSSKPDMPGIYINIIGNTANKILIR